MMVSWLVRWLLPVLLFVGLLGHAAVFGVGVGHWIALGLAFGLYRFVYPLLAGKGVE